MSQMLAPTSRLPPIRSLTTISPDVLLECIAFLRVLYTSEVRGSRIRSRNLQVVGPGSSSLLENSLETPPTAPNIDTDALAALRSDVFERAYTIQWLTAIIGTAEILDSPGDQAAISSSSMEVVIEEAAALLANCGGASSAGVITRVLTFPSKLGLISLSLKDLPLENGDLASIGSQTWGGACVLAELLATDPAGFGLTEVAPLRVLELGSGTGLVGMAFARAAELASREPHVTIICTDFYPSVLKNLAANIAVNFPAENGSGPLISSHFLDWSTFLSDETASLPPFNLPFDLILGADIVYEPEHAAWIYACVAKLLRPPDREDHASTFHLVIPLRATHKLESSTLESVFDARNNTSVTEWKLCILRKEIIVCEVEAGGNKELEYAYYKIGWKHW